MKKIDADDKFCEEETETETKTETETEAKTEIDKFFSLLICDSVFNFTLLIYIEFCCFFSISCDLSHSFFSIITSSAI